MQVGFILRGRDAEDLLVGCYKDFSQVSEVEMVDQSRWNTTFSFVLLEKSTKRFYRASWLQGSTEYQEVDLEIEMVEVYPKEVTKTIYYTKV